MKHKGLVILPFTLALFTSPVQPVIAQSMAQSMLAQANDVATEQKLELTPAERSAIYATVSKDKSKVAPQPFSTTIGAVFHHNRRGCAADDRALFAARRDDCR